MTLSELLDQSGMSTADFCYAIHERKARVIDCLRGVIVTPEPIMSKAHQLMADLEYWDAFFEANPHLRTSYKVFKYVLDDND